MTITLKKKKQKNTTMNVCYGYLLYLLIKEQFNNLLWRVSSGLLNKIRLATLWVKQGVFKNTRNSYKYYFNFHF